MGVRIRTEESTSPRRGGWTAADADRQRRTRARLKSALVWRGDHWYSPLAPTHGTLTSYGTYNCRCAACRAARERYDSQRPPRSPRTPLRPDQHGTPSGYARGCRCTRCASAHNAYRRRQVDELRVYLVEVDGRMVTTAETLHGHGHYVTYRTYSCRCVPCTDANRVRARRYRHQSNANQLRLERLRAGRNDDAGGDA